MKKYLLQGIGLGVILSSSLILLLISVFDLVPKNLSKQEIIEKAKDFGMVEQNSFMTPNGSKETDKKENVKTEATQKEHNNTPADMTKKDESKEITILVGDNDTSLAVTKKLKESGLIEDTKSFGWYLDKLELETKIRTGKFIFQKGMSYDEIIKILTKR